MEAVLAGRVLQRARVHWLGKLAGRSRVLIVGEGPGRLLEELLRRFSSTEVTVVEQSAKMIAVAARRLEKRGVCLRRVRWVCADVRTWHAEDENKGRLFDAVLTPFLLDCFARETLERLVEKLGTVTARDAVWLVADFQVPSRGWQRMRAKLIHAVMYRFFRVATRLEASRLTEPDEALRRVGFVLEGRTVFNAGLVRSDWWVRT
ncbi:MAG: class I SAM-dependent methyltransferase [Nibricoccus sp.]